MVFKKLLLFLGFFSGFLIIFLLTLSFIKTKKPVEIVPEKYPTSTQISEKNKMYFTYQQESIDKINKIITVKLDGPGDIKADAIDLQLDFNDNIAVKKIITGDSFLFYPRKIIKENYLLVTGVAINQNNQVLFAKPKTTFIKIKIEIKKPDQKISIKFNPQQSKIYFSGIDIADPLGSFSKINF